MMLNPSKVGHLLSHLILASALARAIAEEVQGQCNSESSDGLCEAADALPAPGGDVLRSVTPACEDKASECSFWASEGECENNPNYMLSESRIARKRSLSYITLPHFSLMLLLHCNSQLCTFMQ